MVKIRYEDDNDKSVVGPWIAQVQFFLRFRDSKTDSTVRLAICHFYKRVDGGELEVGVEDGRTTGAARSAKRTGKREHVWVAERGEEGQEIWSKMYYAEYLDRIDTKVVALPCRWPVEGTSKIFFQKASFHSKV